MRNIVTLGEINDALKIAAVTAAQLADMGFAALANKPICEGLPPEESRRLRNAKLYPAESIGQIRVALAQRFAEATTAADVPASGAAALSEYLKTCEQHAIVPDVGGAFASAFAAGFNLASSLATPDKRTDLVPGVMRCAKCEFQLVRKVLAVNMGDVFAGDSKTEPCPNGCGPLWPVTWKQYAEQAMDAAESLADRAFAAEKEVKQLRGELSALDAPSLRAKVMSTPLGLHGTGIGDIGTAYRAGHRAALLTAADLVASTVVAAPAAVAVPGGWQLVPMEGTEEMARAFRAEATPALFYMTTIQCADFQERYRAMLGAAPALAATPAAVEFHAEGDPAALLQLANLLESGRGLIHVERKEIANALRALSATPAAAAPVVLPERDSHFFMAGWNGSRVGADANKHFADASKSAPLAGVSAPAAQAVERGEVLVTVSGFTGCGKSALAGEIEIMCRALGLQVEWPDGASEKNMTHADWTAALEQYKPRVRIVECNVPHSVVKGQDK